MSTPLRFSLPAFLFLALLFTACQPTEPISEEPSALELELRAQLERAFPGMTAADYQFPQALADIPQDPRNPLTEEKIQLGQWLYHETGTARNPMYTESMFTYSCASCHHAAGGFQANRQQGIGDGGLGFGYEGEGRRANANYAPEDLDVQPIRTPSALNVAFQRVMLWNGQFGATGPNAGTEARWTPETPIATNELGYEGVETQAIAGLGVHRQEITHDIITELGYLAEFDKAFADFPAADRYTLETAGLAIAAYERTLFAHEAPFQRWLAGDIEAMTEQQKEGALLFFGKAECVSCHQGPALNSEAFHALGMPDLSGPGVFNTPADASAHLGRGGFTGKAEDMYAFKVPQLYNLKDSPFLGHGGTFRSVEEVIRYKNHAISANGNVSSAQLAPGFQPLLLSNEEIEALTAFIEEGLYDPQLSRFEPTSLPSGACFPNADLTSKYDLDCQ